MPHPHHVVAIVGPTAAGKTAVAIEAARRLACGVEIVSADSRQVRREMRVGTAAPTEAELAAVPHHLVGIVAPDQPYAVVDWLADAHAALDGIWARGRLPLLVGGTGQYVWALLDGQSIPAVEPDPALRAEFEAYAAERGAKALHARLAALDPASAARIDARNVRRVVRALEVVTVTGAPVPPRESRDLGFTWRAIGLHWNRAVLHARADARVHAMFETGLVEEARSLAERYGRGFPALSSIGYREALGVIDGRLSEAEAVRQTQIATHRLIRMQAAWFRLDDPRIEWVPGDDIEATVAAVERAARAPVP
ncbi:MAG: tRNA (adenosine(37)-N6)-dimethylallyltransferase MiaA [Dehalococcoidia bacterium]|nr:MAG: tRNA (adenosine(37)-N6)-dimethylallyltransferase MiaA [Dehalococcoidia bacterium]